MENPNDIITIKTYYSDAEAEFAKDILKANGIRAMVAGRTSMWIGSGVYSSPELRVKRKEAEKALKILEEARQPIKRKDKNIPMIKRKEFLSNFKAVMIFAVILLLVMIILSWLINR